MPREKALKKTTCRRCAALYPPSRSDCSVLSSFGCGTLLLFSEPTPNGKAFDVNTVYRKVFWRLDDAILPSNGGEFLGQPNGCGGVRTEAGFLSGE
jgi:hypothetical protein